MTETTTLRLASANGPVTRTIQKTPLRDASPSEIPIIDVSDIYNPSIEARKAVAAKVREASANTGFFYIKNHGIDDSVPQAAYQSTLDFFRQELPTKMEAETSKSKYQNGYQPTKTQRVNADEGIDFRESFFWRYDARIDPDFTSEDALPEAAKKHLMCEDFIQEKTKNLPHFVPALETHFVACLKLARALTRTFALSLNLDEDFFDAKCVYPEASFTLNYYPPIENPKQSPEGEVSIGSHTDFQFFTILWQDQVGGLQVLSREGQWIRATPIEGTFVVNIADYMQRITNDLYVSTVHRAQNWSGKERVSLPFFWGFGLHESCGVLDNCIKEGEKAKYEEINCEDWVNKRMDYMFAVNDEVDAEKVNGK